MLGRFARRLKRPPRVDPKLWASWADPRPEPTTGQVVFAVLTKFGFHGKANAARYFPEFCRVLREHGLAVRFCTDLDQVHEAMSGQMPTVLVSVYPEDRVQIASSKMDGIEEKAVAVYNRASLGPILADKQETADFFRVNDLPTPPPAQSDSRAFTNARYGSHKGAALVEPGSALDKRRHNTQFIDTTVSFENTSYHTTVRLLAIGEDIVHAFVRARDTGDADPSVHEGDTPENPALLEFLQVELVEKRFEDFETLARRLADKMGSGFFVHDLLLESDSDRIFVCESGLKFDYGQNWLRFEPISDQLPSLRAMFPLEAYAARCGEVFAKQCKTYIERSSARNANDATTT